MSTRRYELDLWASALGADNDDDAMAAVHRLWSRADGLGDEVQQLLDDIPTGGVESNRGDDIVVCLTTAMNELEEVVYLLGQLSKAFGRHERGVA